MSLAVRLRPNAVCPAPRLAFKVTILKFSEASRLKIRLTSGRENAKLRYRSAAAPMCRREEIVLKGTLTPRVIGDVTTAHPRIRTRRGASSSPLEAAPHSGALMPEPFESQPSTCAGLP